MLEKLKDQKVLHCYLCTIEKKIFCQAGNFGKFILVLIELSNLHYTIQSFDKSCYELPHLTNI